MVKGRVIESGGVVKGRVIESGVLDKFRFVKVCITGKNRATEVYIRGKECFVEFRITVEGGFNKISFFNCEVVQGVENWCPAEIKIKITPYASGARRYGFFVFIENAAALTHCNKNSPTYIFLLMKLRIVCNDVFRFFVLIRIFEAFA